MMSNTLMTMTPPTPPTHAQRERLDSFADTPTGLITLSPEFLEAVRQVAPRIRRRTLPYVLVLAAVAGLGAASARRVFLHPPSGVRVSAPPATPAASAPPATTTADSADRALSAPPAPLPAAAPTTISAVDLAPAGKSKTPKTRPAKTPR
jgi:hypothetical protein